MALPININDREFQKFEEVSGDVCVRTKLVDATVTGTFTPSGLNIAGKVTIVTIDNTTWTALPATALTNRNALAIQNTSGQEIKLNYDNSTVGYVGVVIPNQGERQYDIKDTIIVYAKSSTSSCQITVEELS